MKRKTRIRATKTKAKLAAIEVDLKNHLSPRLKGPTDNLRLTGSGLVREVSFTPRFWSMNLTES
jgi:hypothetical protein